MKALAAVAILAVACTAVGCRKDTPHKRSAKTPIQSSGDGNINVQENSGTINVSGGQQ